MIILGLDPGTATTGYGVIQQTGRHIQCLAYGTINTTPDTLMPRRLEIIYDDLGQILQRFRPDAAAIEQLFFGRNTTTAITVGQARGILLLRLQQEGIPVGEYTPMQVKNSLVGYGLAEKKQVQYMVQNYLNLPEIPKPDDAADALAIAICHAHSMAGRI
jgi:crossover junction endodeoxyribonuclease RuvC